MTASLALFAMAGALSLDTVSDSAAMPPPEPVRTAAETPVAEPGANDPLVVELAYTADLWTLVRGGKRRGTRYLDNVDVIATADLDRLAGLRRTKAAVYLLYNNGQAFSENLVGDTQAISNIETGVRAVRLYEAWIEHKGADDRWSIKAGLYDLNSEFDALETSGLFIGSAHGIGTDISQTGRNGPSIFPSTSLAIRGQARLGPQVTVRAALLDGVPNDPDRPGRLLIRIGGKDGAMVIGETDADLGPVRLIGGVWHYTARTDHVHDLAIAHPEPRQVHNQGVYVRGEAQLAGQRDEGLRGFFRLGLADGDANPFGGFASAGLAWRGLLAGRSEDETGIALARAFASPAMRRASRIATARAPRAETAIELTHRFAIADWLSVQPDAQYIIDPGLDPALDNAVSIGVRFAAAISF